MTVSIQVFKDTGLLSTAAAEKFVQAAAHAVQARGRFLTALSGGGTPTGLYRQLAAAPFYQQVDWQKTFAFWGDERCVPPDDESSNYRQAMDAFLGHISIPSENIQRIKGELGPAEAARDYIRTLKRFAFPPLEWPRFDLVLLGLGADGHTASLFPGSPMDRAAPALPVTAHYQGRPAERVTLTPSVFNSARRVIFLAAGESKSGMLARVINGERNPGRIPAQQIRPREGRVIWLVDEAAAADL